MKLNKRHTHSNGADKHLNNCNSIGRYTNIIYMAAFFAMLSIAACKKEYNDKYKPVNDITLSNKADTLTVLLGDTIKITPVISQSMSTNTTGLKYQWTVLIPASGDTTSMSLATTRNLNVIAALPPSSNYYLINYKVTDASTGITFRKTFPLHIISNFAPGWMLLENDGGTADISFFNTSSLKSFHHLFSTANPANTLPVSTNVLSVTDIAATATSGTSSGTIAVPQQTICAALYANNGYLFDYSTFKVLTTYAKYFSNAPAVIHPQMLAKATDKGTAMLTINAGQLYQRAADQGQQDFGGVPFVRSDNLPYYLAPFFVTLSSGIRMYFDNTSHSFLFQQSVGTTLFPSVPYVWNSTAVSPTEKILAMGTGLGASSCTAITFNTADNKCYLDMADAVTTTYLYFSPEGIYKQLILDNQNAVKSPAFCFEKNNSQFFYSVDNTMYINQYNSTDYNSDTGGFGVNSSSSVYAFASGENITDMKLASDESTLVVATYNGTSGTLYFFPVDQTGSVSSYSTKYTGFGKIVDMAYKQ